LLRFARKDKNLPTPPLYPIPAFLGTKNSRSGRALRKIGAQVTATPLCYLPTISTVFIRELAPVVMRIRLLATPKCFATSSISCSFALPSTGGAESRTTSEPSACGSTPFLDDLGMTLTRMYIAFHHLPQLHTLILALPRQTRHTVDAS